MQSGEDRFADKTHSSSSSSLQMRLTLPKVVLQFDCFMNGKNSKKAKRVGVRAEADVKNARAAGRVTS